MKIHPAAPNSLEWLLARAGVVTASEFDQFLNVDFELRTGEMVKSYRARKLAEKWLGGPLAGYQSLDMEFGHILEEQAIPFYELTTEREITRVGLITTDDGRAGCSPDGLIGDDSGIEIKCPRPETHVKYLLSGGVPKEYLAQVHGAMYVTGHPQWVFMSYCRRMPPLILTVERDDVIQEQIAAALGKFLESLEITWNHLCELNDGPPKRTPFVQYIPKPQPGFIPNTEDVPT